MLFHGTFGKLYWNDERRYTYSHDIIYTLIIGFILYVSSHAYNNSYCRIVKNLPQTEHLSDALVLY